MTDHEQGVLSSTMSDASAAMILGWSVARVKRARTVEPPIPDAMPVPPPLPPEPPPPPSPLPENVTRWVRAFDRAGWRLLEIARLFDLDPDQLSEAL